MFDKDKIVDAVIQVSCTTEEEAVKLLTWADSIGLKWRSGMNLLTTRMQPYDSKTVYYLRTSGCTYGCEAKSINTISFKEAKLKQKFNYYIK